ncbi:hypothetical protein GCM10007923_41950 [Shinella yambaruensis]|uniref:Uncharacterized protein n=1 Tax=Shinella yambaruensis TaxID=415996 RepID=A0ABQ5ZLQ1_9HYPH|nr:hypothetical protein GCM10007923_41950 [Shinella yambaruensis]
MKAGFMEKIPEDGLLRMTLNGGRLFTAARNGKDPDAGDIRAFGEVSGKSAYLQTLIFLMTTLP